jgi:integrase
MLDEARRPRSGKKGFPNNSDSSLRDYAAICLMYYGGLRISEVCTLRISDLDLDNKRIRVHEGKGKDYSQVNVSDEAILSLRDYLERGRPKPTKAEVQDRLMLSSRGNPITRSLLYAQVKKIAYWAGIQKNVHPHIFRHSMITHMAEKGKTALVIQVQSRHKSLDMLQRYTHMSEKTVRDAYDDVFAKKATTAPSTTESAQKPSVTLEDREKGEGAREKLIDLCVSGKISGAQLEKLLSNMDGHVQRMPSVEGYA